MDTECTEQVITNISAVDSRSPELAKEIAQAQVVTTAVGLGILMINHGFPPSRG